MDCFIYMMASARNGPLYTGVTSDLVRRVWLHQHHGVPGFTSRSVVNRLVWFESASGLAGAIAREKELKGWKREWQVVLVERMNPYWRDLYEEVLGAQAPRDGSTAALAITQPCGAALK